MATIIMMYNNIMLLRWRWSVDVSGDVLSADNRVGTTLITRRDKVITLSGRHELVI